MGNPVDKLNAMAIFVRVVERGSFSAVARESGTTQPTISRQIARLEGELGTQLLVRGATGLRLTDSGEAFYARAKQVVEDLDSLRADLGRSRGSVSGTLRVNCPAAFGETWLTPVLVQLAEPVKTTRALVSPAYDPSTSMYLSWIIWSTTPVSSSSVAAGTIVGPP
jgi:DNA-binding transcriptional LysR family regulator